MSSNSTASPGAATPCCKATTLLAAVATSFVFCFILVVAFLFLRFLLHRRRWRRRSARLLLQQQQQQQPHRPKLFLDAAAIALIPAFPYRVAGAGGAACSTSGPAECAVCLSALDEGQMARELPGCKHVFHRECIDVWLASSASCPVCRRNAEPPVRAEQGAAASTSSARVVAIEMFDDEVEVRTSSSSTPGEAESAPWTRPEAGSASTT